MFGRIAKPAMAMALLGSFILFSSPAIAGGACPNEVCEPEFGEDCINCPQDCTCPLLSTTTTSTLPDPPPTTLPPPTTTTTSTTTTTDTTSTTVAPTTSTTAEPPTTSTTSTTTTTDTTSTTMEVVGACCGLKGCVEVPQENCPIGYQGDGTDCETAICGPTSSSSTTTEPTGACCNIGFCTDGITQSFCEVGTFHVGEDCSATVCGSVCGNGCREFGETCDDGDTESNDGCSSSCQEEACFNCSEPQGDLVPTGPSIICPTGGQSTCTPTGACDVCGDEVVGVSEDCDDGNTANGDCCSSTCDFESSQSPCNDGLFCNGADKCDGEGSCVNAGTPADCSSFNTACTVADCDEEVHCFGDPEPLEGTECTAVGTCLAGDSGQCEAGTCVGEGTTLSPSCRWIIIGGNPQGNVKIQNGPGSIANASICGDTAKAAGTTAGSYVVMASSGTGIRFGRAAEVDGDIATDGAGVSSTLYGKVPGTQVKSVPGGTTMAKLPSGMVNTTGSHPLVDVCSDDQDLLVTAKTALNNKLKTEPTLPQIKVGVGGSFPIDVTGDGVAVLETPAVKVGHHGSLSITGGPNDVLMLRITSGRFILGYGASVNLSGGIKPENVLFYSQWRTCRLAPGVTGSGTVFCPDAVKFVIGSGVDWQGTFLGGAKEIRAKLRSSLTHVPFLGF